MAKLGMDLHKFVYLACLMSSKQTNKLSTSPTVQKNIPATLKFALCAHISINSCIVQKDKKNPRIVR